MEADFVWNNNFRGEEALVEELLEDPLAAVAELEPVMEMVSFGVALNILQPLSTKLENMPSLALFMGIENLGDLKAAYSALTTTVKKQLMSIFIFNFQKAS